MLDVTRRLLNKPQTSDDIVRLFEEKTMRHLNFGYAELNNLTPFSGIEYTEAQNGYKHIFSLKQTGYDYAMGNMSDFIGIKDYLTLPNSSVELLLEGMLEGKKERSRLIEESRKAEEAKNRDKNRNGNSVNEADLLSALKGLADK